MSSSPNIDVVSSPERDKDSPPPRKETKPQNGSYTSFSISSILSKGDSKQSTQTQNPSLDMSHLAAAAALHPCGTDSSMLSR